MTPKLLVLSAPSGAGKSTICNLLLERNPDFRLSISATTRPPRGNERNAVEYFFLSKDEFFAKVERNEFLEYAEVHGHYYGTLKSSVEALLQQGFTVLFDIDVIGALNIKKQYPEAMLIFIRPPSQEELIHRLKNRKTENEAQIQKRLERLPMEYENARYFDHQVVNDDLLSTVERVEQLIRGQ